MRTYTFCLSLLCIIPWFLEMSIVMSIFDLLFQVEKRGWYGYVEKLCWCLTLLLVRLALRRRFPDNTTCPIKSGYLLSDITTCPIKTGFLLSDITICPINLRFSHIWHYTCPIKSKNRYLTLYLSDKIRDFRASDIILVR